MSAVPVLPGSVDAVVAALATQNYLCDRRLATALFLALKLQRPLFLEGEPGVGKTELAKALAALLATPLLRLQCYEGLDIAQTAYEWNVARQMVEIRLAEASQHGAQPLDHDTLVRNLYSRQMLIERPLLQALTQNRSPVLLIDELDRADEPFDAYLLEVLAENQITIPELGTVRASAPPITLITSNRTREVHDALKRRCLYHLSLIHIFSTFASSVPTILYATLLAGQYKTPAIYAEVKAVFTNTAPVDAYRGAGRPEATYLVERIVETAARDMGMDPAAIRRQNFITSFPYATPVGLTRCV